MAFHTPQFHSFPLLPTELRLQIWALAIPHRLLPITCIKGILQPSKRRYAQRFTTTSPPPALLSTCRESRAIAQPIYSVHFRITAPQPSSSGIWVSFAHDTVSLPENTIAYLPPLELAGIERMELEVGDYAYFGYFNLATMRAMGGLRELVLSVHEGVRYSWSSPEAVPALVRDLKIEALDWPAWRVPDVVRFVEAGTGRELAVVRGREDLLEFGLMP